MNTVTRDPNPYGFPSFNQNPSELDPAFVTNRSLLTRRDDCEENGVGDDYNLPIHVIALFVVLLVSTMASGFSMASKRYPRLRIPGWFLFVFRHFGTGVILATAFVHLIGGSYTSLFVPCMGKLWYDDYPPLPMVVSMASVYFVVVIEMIFSHSIIQAENNFQGVERKKKCKGKLRKRVEHMWGMMHRAKVIHLRYEEEDDEKENAEKRRDTDTDTSSNDSSMRADPAANPDSDPQKLQRMFTEKTLVETTENEGEGSSNTAVCEDLEVPAQNTHSFGSRHGSFSGSVSHGLRFLNESNRPEAPKPGSELSHSHTVPTITFQDEDHHHHPREIDVQRGEFPGLEEEDLEVTAPRGFFLTREQRLRKQRLSLALLEMGILFHSVFIGMALSVTIGTDFVVLLIAILFHQMFEGLALGARLAAVEWPHGAKMPWIMVCLYGITTPVGQAIGLAIHTLYSPYSYEGRVIIGVMYAISGGMLMYAGLVELLAEDFISDASWDVLKGKERVAAFILLLLGSTGMSVVGIWA